uniref:Uncharacterized protein n=1 Tax=Megaselia scalaris TaxID=36166 RepID=T1GB10_MEGSC
MIYFFGPILAMIAVNIVLFILTSLKIHKVQKELSKITARCESKRNLNSEKDSSDNKTVCKVPGAARQVSAPSSLSKL